MVDSKDASKKWVTHVSGTLNLPQEDRLILIRHGSPRVLLEIDVPGLQSAGDDQRQMGREAIRQVLNSLQEALDSPTALAGFRSDRT